MKHFVVVMRNEDMWLVGPFDSDKDAAAWGRDPDNNPEDDPRWQTIELPEGFVLRTEAP